MNDVQPVKDLAIVALIPELLIKHYTQQFADVWIFGVNTALRITDLLNIKFSEIKDDRLCIREGKTKKVADILLNDRARAIVARIRAERPQAIYLFESNIYAGKPLTRQAVGQTFKAIGDIVGVRLNTHSMRKTRGYHLYQKTKRIEPIMKMLRHSRPSDTLRYIGIDQDEMDQHSIELEL